MNDIIKELRQPVATSFEPDRVEQVVTEMYKRGFKAADIIEQQEARIAELEARSAQDVHDISKLLDTIKYLRGIAERGMHRKQIDTESVEQFVLGYVKQLEADNAMIAELQAREVQLRDALAYYANGSHGKLNTAAKALSQPADDSALQALLTAEREACAKVCESLFDLDDNSCSEAETCAAAIRNMKGEK